MNPSGPILRFVGLILTLAVGIRLAWELIRPALVPFLIVAGIAVVAGWFFRRQF